MPCVVLVTGGAHMPRLLRFPVELQRTCVGSNPDDDDDDECQLWCRDHDDEVLGSVEFPPTMTILVP